MLLNVCLLVLRLLFFEKFAGAPMAKSMNKYGMGAPHRASYKAKNILNLMIGLFKAPLSHFE